LSPVTMIIVALLFVINLGLLSWAVTDLMQRNKVKYLPKFGWIIIIAMLPYGSVIYLLAGRE
jgi:type VI protein secretion system component VasK